MKIKTILVNSRGQKIEHSGMGGITITSTNSKVGEKTSVLIEWDVQSREEAASMIKIFIETVRKFVPGAFEDGLTQYVQEHPEMQVGPYAHFHVKEHKPSD